MYACSPTFKREDGDVSSKLAMIQCDSGHLNADLIACARYRIYDVKARPENKGITHVVFIIHLTHHQEKSLFVGFQGDPWISVHIDDLRPTSECSITPHQAMGSSISQLFLGNRAATEVIIPMDVSEEGDEGFNREEPMDELPFHSVEDNEMEVEEHHSEAMSDTSSIEVDQTQPRNLEEALTTNEEVFSSDAVVLPPQYRRLHGCIQAAASKLQDAARKRATKRVEILVNLIPREPYYRLGMLLLFFFLLEF